jgi:hypothetical protein
MTLPSAISFTDGIFFTVQMGVRAALVLTHIELETPFCDSFPDAVYEMRLVRRGVQHDVAQTIACVCFGQVLPLGDVSIAHHVVHDQSVTGSKQRALSGKQICRT